MTTGKFVIRPHDRATYERLQDSRISQSEFQTDMIYNMMLKIDAGRHEAGSVNVRFERLIRSQGYSTFMLMLLRDDFAHARTVSGIAGPHDFLVISASEEIVFADPADGVMRTGYLLPHQETPEDDLISARRGLTLHADEEALQHN